MTGVGKTTVYRDAGILLTFFLASGNMGPRRADSSACGINTNTKDYISTETEHLPQLRRSIIIDTIDAC